MSLLTSLFGLLIIAEALPIPPFVLILAAIVLVVIIAIIVTWILIIRHLLQRR